MMTPLMSRVAHRAARRALEMCTLKGAGAGGRGAGAFTGEGRGAKHRFKCSAGKEDQTWLPVTRYSSRVSHEASFLCPWLVSTQCC